MGVLVTVDFLAQLPCLFLEGLCFNASCITVPLGSKRVGVRSLGPVYSMAP